MHGLRPPPDLAFAPTQGRSCGRANPPTKNENISPALATRLHARARRTTMPISEFRNAPLTDFSQPDQHEAFQRALDNAERQLGSEYALVIGGNRVTTGAWIESTDPSQR